MIDIIGADSDGLQTFDTQTQKAKNVLSVQIGDLEYAQDFGIDLRYFMTEGIKFQNESFQAYLVERLANNGINVATVTELVETLSEKYTFNLSPEETSTGLVAR